MMDVIQIPVLHDNYVYVVVCHDTQKAAIVDPAVAAPVLEYFDDEDVTPVAIWNTHHHFDHVGGNEEILERYPDLEVVAGSYDAENQRIPGLTRVVKEGDEVTLGKLKFEVLDIPGHTLGHIAYVGEGSLFCGDTLFAAGCGRLFEGTPEQMFASLQKIKALANETLVFCAHEYTHNNLDFALSVEPADQALQKRLQWVKERREQDLPTVPFTIDDELQTNLFLRAQGVQEFASLRRRKDEF